MKAKIIYCDGEYVDLRIEIYYHDHIDLLDGYGFLADGVCVKLPNMEFGARIEKEP